MSERRVRQRRRDGRCSERADGNRASREMDDSESALALELESAADVVSLRRSDV